MKSQQRTIRVAIADDHALFRQGLRSVLNLQHGIDVVAEVDTIDQIAGTVAEHHPDVLLLDLQMDRSALSEIPNLSRSCVVVVVTASEIVEEAIMAIRKGARAVVLKHFAIETLMDAVKAVTDGQVWVPPHLQGALVEQLQRADRDQLTTRERDIVRWVGLGLRNAEIAQRLFITEPTVKTHLNNIFRKLGLRDRVELARHALQVGIVGIHEKA